MNENFEGSYLQSIDKYVTVTDIRTYFVNHLKIFRPDLLTVLAKHFSLISFLIFIFSEICLNSETVHSEKKEQKQTNNEY